jgi:outer membrane biosynthesis protein TonB
MRLRRYLTWTLVGATILSLLLHFFTIFGESIFGFIEAQLEPEAAIRKTTRKLAEQSLDEEDLAEEAKKAKAKPLIDKVTVYLVPAAKLRPVAAPAKPVANKPQRKPKTKPKPKPKAAPAQVEAKAVEPVVAEAAAETTTDTAPVPAVVPEAVKPEVASVAEPAKSEPAPTEAARRKGTYQPGEARKGFPRHVRVKMLAMGIGEGFLEWKRDKNTYRIEADASALGQRRRLVSQGIITASGLRPNDYKVYVGSSEQPDHQCLFNWEAGTVQVGKVEEMKTEPLDEDAQDLLSFTFQFAAYGSKMKDFDIQLCSGRRIEHQTLAIQGETTLFIAGRDVPVLVLRGENERGKAEAWLAPDWNNIPVKMFFDSNKRKISGSMVATELEIDGKTVLAPPKPVDPDLYSGGG